MIRRCITAVSFCVFTFGSVPAFAQCGGDFNAWLKGAEQEAKASGVGRRGLSAIRNAKFDRKVIRADRSQGVFAQSFLKFSGRAVSQHRLDHGRNNLKKFRSTFDRIEQTYGVPRAVIAAFWGLETDYGANQGSFNTMNALATLAHDCRRPDLFRPQFIAAARLVDAGHLRLEDMVGAWAGELGQTQVLPSDYLEKGVDFDGDGRIDLKRSTPDALASSAKFIRALGWQTGQPWLEEVTVSNSVPWQEADLLIKHPRNQWRKWGVTYRDGSRLPNDRLPASLILPMGRNGPAFLAYPNFDIYLEWNKSLVYTTTAAYFATRLDGKPKVRAGSATALPIESVKVLQQKLANRGYDMGKIDGIIGIKTRAAVKAEQLRLGMPPDSYPDQRLLNRL